MYAQVGILNSVGDIAQQEMTAPIRIHYKFEGTFSLRGKIGEKLVDIPMRRFRFG